MRQGRGYGWPKLPKIAAMAIVVVVVTPLNGCGQKEETVTDRVDVALQEQLESSEFALKAERCIGRREDRYICSVWVAERMTKPQFLSLGQQRQFRRCLGSSEMKILRDGSVVRCGGIPRPESEPDYFTAKGIWLVTVDLQGERPRFTPRGHPLPYPLPADFRRDLERRYPASLFPSDWEDPRGQPPHPE